MAMLVWAMMGLAIWHFTIFLPDRFWRGIVGAYLGALSGEAHRDPGAPVRVLRAQVVGAGGDRDLAGGGRLRRLLELECERIDLCQEVPTEGRKAGTAESRP